MYRRNLNVIALAAALAIGLSSLTAIAAPITSLKMIFEQYPTNFLVLSSNAQGHSCVGGGAVWGYDGRVTQQATLAPDPGSNLCAGPYNWTITPFLPGALSTDCMYGSITPASYTLSRTSITIQYNYKTALGKPLQVSITLCPTTTNSNITYTLAGCFQATNNPAAIICCYTPDGNPVASCYRQ